MKKQTLRNTVRRSLPSAITIVVVALMLAGFRAWAMPAADPASTNAIAGVVSYQGYLTDTSGEPVSGSVGMTFRLYTVPSGGTAVWTEARTGGNAVPVQSGLFNVMLGGLNPIPAGVWSNAELFLGVQAGSDPEMSPREPVGMVPYALLAQRATGLSAPDGDPADALVVTNDGELTAGSGPIKLGSNLFIPEGGMCIDNDGGCTIPGPGGLRVGEIYGLRYGAGPIVHLGPELGSRVGIRTGDPQAELDVRGKAAISNRLGIGTTDPQAELDVRGDIDWSGDLKGFTVESFEASTGGTTACGSVDNRVCFLRRVHFVDGTGDVEWRRCRVIEEDGNWLLMAESTGGAGVYCGATCLIW